MQLLMQKLKHFSCPRLSSPRSCTTNLCDEIFQSYQRPSASLNLPAISSQSCACLTFSGWSRDALNSFACVKSLFHLDFLVMSAPLWQSVTFLCCLELLRQNSCGTSCLASNSFPCPLQTDSFIVRALSSQDDLSKPRPKEVHTVDEACQCLGGKYQSPRCLLRR